MHGRADRRCVASPVRRNSLHPTMRRLRRRRSPPTGVLLALLFQFQESAEFKYSISQRTRRDYIKQIKRIERDFGDFPIKALDDPRHDPIFSNGAIAGKDIATASRLCLRHVGTYSLLGAQPPPDRNKPVRPWRQALSRHAR